MLVAKPCNVTKKEKKKQIPETLNTSGVEQLQFLSFLNLPKCLLLFRALLCSASHRSSMCVCVCVLLGSCLETLSTAPVRTCGSNCG